MPDPQHAPAPPGKPPFCSEPGTPCDCSNDYRKVCEPGWSSLKFPEKHSELGAVSRSYEAHHILCVSKIADHIVAPKQSKGYAAELDNAKWCINHKSNMIALPRWGHTIMWYCRSLPDITYDAQGSITNTQVMQPGTGDLIRPPFKNLPQHDYGHRGSPPHQGYEEEVAGVLEEYSDSLRKAVKKHDQATLKEIAPRLRGFSSDFRSQLKTRGKRAFGGTHGAWKAGAADPTVADWYKPFSMANNPRPMTFPAGTFNQGLGTKIRRIANALFKLNHLA